MSKITFREAMANLDTEVDLIICSTENIHTEEKMDAIARVLSKIDLRALEKGRRSPIKDHPKEFEDLEAVPVYELKAKVGWTHDDDCGLVSLQQELATEANIKSRYIKVWPKGGEIPNYNPSDDHIQYGGNIDLTQDDLMADMTPVLGTEPGKHDLDKDAFDYQSTVGSKRIDTLLKDMEKRSKEKQTAHNAKMKKIITTHLGIKEWIGESKERGYYIIRHDGKKVRRMDGPYPTRPSGTFLDSGVKLKNALEG